MSNVLDSARAVREGEELDIPSLEAYFKKSLPELAGAVTVQQFPKGHSNLTYLLNVGKKEVVLRRPPFGRKIKTAHDMGREYRILAALQGVYDKAPRPYVHCEDESVIGAPFYVMARVPGVILRGNDAPKGIDLNEGVMRRLSTALIDGLAELHSVDVNAAGLANFGKPEGYVERQVTGWTKRYLAAKTDEVPAFEEAAKWLAQNMPTDSAGDGALGSLIHGDFKYDNVVLSPDDITKITAVLDWEMATLGDPLMDLGTTLGYWIEQGDPDGNKMLGLGPTSLPGNLNRLELVERYAKRTGRNVDNALFYFVYGLLKIAVIAQQIYKRFVEGHSKDPRFQAAIMGVHILSKTAALAIEKDRIYDLA